MLNIKRSKIKELSVERFGDDSPEHQNSIVVMIATSLAARTSYTVVGDEKEINYKRMIELHDEMAVAKPFHASPFEHCARTFMGEDNGLEEYGRYAKVTASSIKTENTNFYNRKPSYVHVEDGWCRNFRGFIPYRHILETGGSI